MRVLFSGSPLTTTGPPSLPLSTAARESRRKPNSWRLAPWHATQFSTRTGRTFFSKNSTASGPAGSAAAATPPNVRRPTTAASVAGFMKRRSQESNRGGRATLFIMQRRRVDGNHGIPEYREIRRDLEPQLNCASAVLSPRPDGLRIDRGVLTHLPFQFGQLV